MIGPKRRSGMTGRDDGGTYQRAGFSIRGAKGAFTSSHLSQVNPHSLTIGALHCLQPHYQNNVFHLLCCPSPLSLAFLPPCPKTMHFLTGSRCKGLIAGLQGTRLVPCILIQVGLQHRGLTVKQSAPDKSTRPGHLFSVQFPSLSPLATNCRAITTGRFTL